MQISDLNQEEVRKFAEAKFPGKYIDIEITDFFLPDIESGKVQLTGVEVPYYVSTHYAYEDRLVNNNQTRYKVSLTIIFVKKDAFEVLYDSYGKCFAIYYDMEMKCIAYEDFYENIRKDIKILE